MTARSSPASGHLVEARPRITYAVAMALSAWRLGVAMAAALVAALSLSGCKDSKGQTGGGMNVDSGQPAGDASAASSSAQRDPGAAWPFWPTSMRFHPLTRAVHEGSANELVIEARIEFLDSDGETSKAAGQLTLQLYADVQSPSGPDALRTWNQDLRDLSINRQRYDDITRTYLFRLEMDQTELPQGAQLRAFFLSIDGQHLDAVGPVK